MHNSVCISKKKKISYECRVYDSVDNISLSCTISLKPTKKKSRNKRLIIIKITKILTQFTEVYQIQFFLKIKSLKKKKKKKSLDLDLADLAHEC